MKVVCAGMMLIVLSLLPQADAQPATVFRGRPAVKISEGGTSRNPEKLGRENAINLECVISQIGEDFYWASRENVPMVRIEKGAFVTYLAVTGAGYVKVIKPEMKAAASLLGETEAEFDYVEHLTQGLASVTYYGRARP
jgi:hypothetical protein